MQGRRLHIMIYALSTNFTWRDEMSARKVYHQNSAFRSLRAKCAGRSGGENSAPAKRPWVIYREKLNYSVCSV